MFTGYTVKSWQYFPKSFAVITLVCKKLSQRTTDILLAVASLLLSVSKAVFSLNSY